MITFDGTTRTDKEDTHRLHEQFRARLGPYVAEPCCENCGHTTCYIVEPVERLQGGSIKPKRFGVGGLLNVMPSAFILDGDNIYLPIKLCLRCGAHGEAAADPTGIKNPDVRGLDVDERILYVREYRKAQANQAEKRLAKSAERNRYKIRGGT